MGPGRGRGRSPSALRRLRRGRAVLAVVAAVALAGAGGCSGGGGGGIADRAGSTTQPSRGNPTITVPRVTASPDGGGGVGEPDATTSVPVPSTTVPPTPTPTPVPTPTPDAPVGPVDGVPAVPDSPATALLDGLRLTGVPVDLPDYRRAAFGDGWDYDGRSGCNTRELVLIEESLEAPFMGERCKPLSGRWVSSYDGVTTTDPADLEIDHFVPLAEAWRTGATGWTAARREAFANDRLDPATLVAVSTHANRSKGDSSPDEWLPPASGARCRYVEDWIRVKARWDLAVSAAEKATLVQVLAGC